MISISCGSYVFRLIGYQMLEQGTMILFNAFYPVGGGATAQKKSVCMLGSRPVAASLHICTCNAGPGKE